MFTFRHFCTLAAVHRHKGITNTNNEPATRNVTWRCIITIIPADANSGHRRGVEMQRCRLPSTGPGLTRCCTAAASRGQIKMSYDSRRCFAAPLLSHRRQWVLSRGRVTNTISSLSTLVPPTSPPPPWQNSSTTKLWSTPVPASSLG